MGVNEQSQGTEENPLEYLREIANETSWEGLAAQISVRSGDKLTATKLWRAASQGMGGLRHLKLTIAQFHALSEVTGLSLDELLVLSQDPRKTTRSQRSSENELN